MNTINQEPLPWVQTPLVNTSRTSLIKHRNLAAAFDKEINLDQQVQPDVQLLGFYIVVYDVSSHTFCIFHPLKT